MTKEETNILSYHVQYIGYKKNGTKAIYTLNVYEYADAKTQKQLQKIESKIIKVLGNKKVFVKFDRNIID